MCDAEGVGEFGYLKCTAGCDYLGQTLHVGAGAGAIDEVPALRRVRDFTTVLVARVGATSCGPPGEDGVVNAAAKLSGVHPMSSRSSTLVWSSSDAVECPRCQAPLAWVSTGI